MEKLPVLISIPHGGHDIPEMYRDRILLSGREVFIDSDTWSRILYGLEDQVECVVAPETARAFVDLNRATGSLKTAFRDGVMRNRTHNGELIWKPGQEPDPEEIRDILETHYYPHHRKLEIFTTRKDLQFAVDCHTMIWREPRRKGLTERRPRPIFCISNLGDREGEGTNLSAPPTFVRHMKDLLEREFRDVEPFPDTPLVGINDPFRGGFITAMHGRRSPWPWLQLEISRALYLPEDDRITGEPGPEDLLRMEEVRQSLHRVLQDLCGA